jgi:hypothetical protein
MAGCINGRLNVFYQPRSARRNEAMRAFRQDDWRERWSFLSMLHCGLEITVPALASAAFAAGGG